MLILLLTNEDILPELVNVYKSPFYLAMRNDDAAIRTKKLHRNGMLPKDVTFFAPCQEGGFKRDSKGSKTSHATDPGKSKGVHFKPKEQCETMTTTDPITKAGEAGENNNEWYVLERGCTHQSFQCTYPERMKCNEFEAMTLARRGYGARL